MKTLPNPVGSFRQPLILVTVVGLFSEASRAQLPIVDPVVRPTTVAIEATRRIAEESSFPFRRLALRGTFTISRTGPTNNSQPVFVHYRGSATPGKDYEALPFLVSIPAGSTSTELSVVAIPDDDAEPIEIVEAELSECPPATTPPLG